LCCAKLFLAEIIYGLSILK
jgi:hypothetical protein